MVDKDILYDEMIREYPNLYHFVSYIECGPGWFDLINELSKNLEKLIIELDVPEEEKPVATQVKEKYGTLRFYLSAGTKEMNKLIEKAELVSSEICENCGKPGEIKGFGWCACLCDECDGKR